MEARCITPILNVSDMAASLAWFTSLGWTVQWQWGEPVGFAAVGSGECEIFLSLNGQGGRGRGPNTRTFGPGGDETADCGMWMSVWVDDVDAVHAQAIAAQVDVVFDPQDMPWGVRECHIRHPDGHVFRLSQSLPEND